MSKSITTPRILPGFMELLPKEQMLFNSMFDTIKKNYEKFGFIPMDNPIIEFQDVLLAKSGGDTEKQVYKMERGDTKMALRFDLTVPLARYIAMNHRSLQFPFKRYNMSKVYRGESPQKGRFREFYQCDIDVIGKDKLSLEYDAEIPNIIYKIFIELGIKDFVIRINNRKLLNGFIKDMIKNNEPNITDEELKVKSTDLIHTIDKIEKQDVTSLLGEYVTKITDFIKINSIEELRKIDIQNEEFQQGLNELEIVEKGLTFPKEFYSIDLRIARGLDYYTGTVYETMITSHPEFGSVCSGGRFEDLVSCYSTEKYPGVGISIGLTRLFNRFLEEKLISTSKATPVDIIIIPNGGTADINKLADKLREKYNVDVYREETSMRNKMKYVDRLGIKKAILINKDDIVLKNMETGEQKKINEDFNI